MALPAHQSRAEAVVGYVEEAIDQRGLRPGDHIGTRADLRDETGVIFASAFPGYDRLADEFERYYAWENQRAQLATLEDLRRYTEDSAILQELGRRIGALRADLEHAPYEFDRRFLFRILAMGHSQFAEYIGARGPNTQVNAACASTSVCIAMEFSSM